MKIASIKSFAARIALATSAAAALLIAGAAPAQAQQFNVAFQYGTPAYVVNHDYRDRAFYARQRVEREAYERRQREEFLRRQQWEREHRYYGRDLRYR